MIRIVISIVSHRSLEEWLSTRCRKRTM